MAKKTEKTVRTLQQVIQEYSNIATQAGDKECQMMLFSEELPKLYAQMKDLVREANTLRAAEQKVMELARAAKEAQKTETETTQTPLQAVT